MLALSTTSIAWLLFVVILVGWIVYAFFNIRSSRDELGSEIELAANRKPYYDDETLEGPRLDRVLGLGVVLLAITVVALPVYWVLEPDRMAGAQLAKEEQFIEWGALLFAPTGDNVSAYNCAGCHGGMGATGGVAEYNITDPATGEVTAVTWAAPALNTIFYRFSEEEVRYILVYGRPFSPMPPWGVEGGGPMNAQQIDTLIAYLRSIQIERDNCGVGEDRRAGLPVRATCRPTSRTRSTPPPTRRSRTARPTRTARRSTTSPWRAARTAAPAATRRVGAGATPASAGRARWGGTSPVAPRRRTSRTSPT